MNGPSTIFSRRAVMTLAGAALALSAPAANAQDAATDNTMVVDGVLAYLGVLPAAMVRGHPRAHPEAAMHGGVPEGRGQYHLILALFNAASGARIETAQVSVTVMGLGHTGGTTLTLDPMQIAGTITWGTFVDLPGSDTYDLTFSVGLPGRETALSLPFRWRTGLG